MATAARYAARYAAAYATAHAARAHWYYYFPATRRQYGPVSLDELRAKVAAGEVGPAALVWGPDGQVWVSAAELPMTDPPADPAGAGTRARRSAVGRLADRLRRLVGRGDR